MGKRRMSIGKRIAAVALSAVLTITGALSGLNVAEKTASAAGAVLPANIGQSILEAEAKYLGYSYSQSYNRHGQDGTETFDCSGLVAQALIECGFDKGTIPDNTWEWRNGFYNLSPTSTTLSFQRYNATGTSYTWRTLSYKGSPVQIVVVDSVDAYTAAMKNNANAGKMVILKTPGDYQALMSSGVLYPGSMLVYPIGVVDGVEKPGHIATVAANVKPSMNGYLKYGTDYPTTYGTSLSYVYNAIKYQKEVYDNASIQKLINIAKGTRNVEVQSVLPLGSLVVEQKAVFDKLGLKSKGFTWPTIQKYMGYEELVWSNYEMFKQPVIKIINKASKKDTDKAYSANGYYGIHSSVWLLEALNKTVGVTITNGAETSATGRKLYAMGFPSVKTYTAVTINKKNSSTGKYVGDAVYALTYSKSLATLISQAKYSSPSEAASEIEKNGGWYAKTTSDGKISYFQKGSMKYTGWSSTGSHTMYMVEAYSPKGYEKDKNMYKLTLYDNGNRSTSAETCAKYTTGKIEIVGAGTSQVSIVQNSKSNIFKMTATDKPVKYYAAFEMETLNLDYDSTISESPQYVNTAIYAIFKGDLVNDNWNTKSDEVANVKNAIKYANTFTKIDGKVTNVDKTYAGAKAAFEAALLKESRSHFLGYINTQADGLNSPSKCSKLIEYNYGDNTTITLVPIYAGSGLKYYNDTNIYRFKINANGNTSKDLTTALKKSTASDFTITSGSGKKISVIDNKTTTPLALRATLHEKTYYTDIGMTYRTADGKNVTGAVYVLIRGDVTQNKANGGWSNYALSNLLKIQKRTAASGSVKNAVNTFVSRNFDDGLLNSTYDRIEGFLIPGETENPTFIRNESLAYAPSSSWGNYDDRIYSLVQIYAPKGYKLDTNIYKLKIYHNGNTNSGRTVAATKSTISSLVVSYGSGKYLKLTGNNTSETLVLNMTAIKQ